MDNAHPPIATYRLQFNASFTFDDAKAITGYLHALGVSHCYASNYFKAVPGSTHGYDVADPTQLNPEVGTRATYDAWVASLRHHGMGHIVDLVPNHMGIARSANPWWQDVLENGPSSRYAHVFDIDWKPLKPELELKVLLPILGGSYGTVLEHQEIQLEYHKGAFSARYFEHLLPIAPGTYDLILSVHADALVALLGEESDAGVEFLSILTAIKRLPPRSADDREQRLERNREKEVIKRRLAALTDASPQVTAHVKQALAVFNGVAGDARSFDPLDALLAAQPYRLAYWRVAAEEINYRRFFDINELAAIRMEDPEVFALTHAFPFELLAEGAVDGFRIDHVDGLYDPGDYLQRLQERAARPPYVVVEKILGFDERLPEWPVAGTTGYEFLNRVNALFVDRRQERAMNEAYERFTRLKVPFSELAYRGKQLILRMSMASELNVLAHHLNRFSERNRHYRDFTLNSLTYAMREVIASFPVYRTYVTGRDAISERDRYYIDRAVRDARYRNPRRPSVVFDFIHDLLLLEVAYVLDDERDEHLRFLAKFQQVTSPVTAKGIEDTALYIYNRLISLNEVGGEPDRFGTTGDALHTWMRERASRWPHGLSASSTHDTKRSEDVRARIDVLSELAGPWRQATTRWARMNRRAHSMIDGASYPSRNEEYLLYQTLIGTWPGGDLSAQDERDYTDRLAAYMLKAMREAKVFTSWLNASEPHEAAMDRFVRKVVARANEPFRTDFLLFQQRVARIGTFNSLAQLAIKITAPGVPDFYQGTELWDYSLVDPDNRRPIDYGRRMALLDELAQRGREEDPVSLATSLLSEPADPRLKLFTTTKLLQMRKARLELFADGGYEPLETGGAHADHVFAYVRTAGAQRVLVAVPRLVATLLEQAELPLGEDVWGDTHVTLPSPDQCCWRQLFTGRCVPVDGGSGRVRAADLFQHFPVAVLERQ